MSLRLQGLPRTWKIRAFRVDKEHSNSFRAWEAARKAMELERVSAGEGAGKEMNPVILHPNTVVLFIWRKPEGKP